MVSVWCWDEEIFFLGVRGKSSGKRRHPFKFDLKENKKTWFDFHWNTPPPQACNLDFFSLLFLSRSDLHYAQSINNFSITTYFLGSFYEGTHSSSKIQNNCVLYDSNRNCRCWWLAAIFPLPIGLFKENLSMVLRIAWLDVSFWLRTPLTALCSSDHCEEKLVIFLGLTMIFNFFVILNFWTPMPLLSQGEEEE